ncbi:MAG: exonuclease SbcCD subunit D [Bacteroidaceae bacterium]|nr:exonuclease SbcCD subunit D [Bacteroidaceae bacterium]
MKILHTSDWHLGHTLYDYDRTEEQTSMLHQMVAIVHEHKPDVFLLSGDVYHTYQPSAAVQTLFTNALVEIHDANPSMTIIITAGNHDSSSKHDIFQTPWKALKVHTIGNIKEADEMIIEIPGKGFVVAVPYVNERSMPEGFYQQLLDMAAERNTEGLPVVLMAHTTVRGCDFIGHDNASDKTVGGIDAYDISELGTGYDYAALGHIHHEQFVTGGHHKVRYCGSPIPISFDENYPHSVSLVDIASHGEQPDVKKIEIRNTRPLVTLPTEGTTSFEEAKDLLQNYPDDIGAYIRLNVHVKDFLPTDAQAEAELLTENKMCRFCYINIMREKEKNDKSKSMSVQEFKMENPIEIAGRYAEDNDIDFDEDLQQLFREALEMVREDERQ